MKPLEESDRTSNLLRLLKPEGNGEDVKLLLDRSRWRRWCNSKRLLLGLRIPVKQPLGSFSFVTAPVVLSHMTPWKYSLLLQLRDSNSFLNCTRARIWSGRQAGCSTKRAFIVKLLEEKTQESKSTKRKCKRKHDMVIMKTFRRNNIFLYEEIQRRWVNIYYLSRAEPWERLYLL